MINSTMLPVVETAVVGFDATTWMMCVVISAIFLIISLMMVDEIRGIIAACVSGALSGITLSTTSQLYTLHSATFFINNSTYIQPVQYLIGHDMLAYISLSILVGCGVSILNHIKNATEMDI